MSSMRSMRSLYRDTRALSPVVATILLVAIAVIASVLTYLWFTGFFGGLTSTQQQPSEVVHIQQQAYYANGTFVLFVQNAGTGSISFQQNPATIVFVTLGGGATNAYPLAVAGCTISGVACPAASAAWVIASGQIAVLKGTAATSTTGTQVTVRIVTVKGTSATTISFTVT